MNTNHFKRRRIDTVTNIIAFIALSIMSAEAISAQPWPAESWKSALALGELEDDFSDGDISGAHWNNNTKTLWVSDNKEEFVSSLIESDETFIVDKSFHVTGDLEGITQAIDDSVLYVMDEDGYIRAIDAFSGNSITTWDISADLPDSGDDGKDGPEGITFIPDTWLSASGFVDSNGNAYAASQYPNKAGFGGIFLVAHQNGGGIYAFDLANDGSYYYIGQYDTLREESSGLAFDRSTGILYISHNIDGNTLEITDLQSLEKADVREFISKAEFTAPNTSNLEGFAIKPTLNEDNSLNDVWAFYTDDDGNTSDGNAILVFKELAARLSVTYGDNQISDANTAILNSPVVQLTHGFNNVLENIDVTFTITQGQGSLTGANTVTDSSGLATLASWTLGASGAQTIAVQAGSASAVITASITGEPITDNDLNDTDLDNTAKNVIATANSHQGDNVASNVLDGDTSTRWSGEGEAWLQLDLGEVKTVTGVSFTFYKGADRSTLFDISTSVNGSDWTVQLESLLSSKSSEAETFNLDNNTNMQFVRFLGHGNDSDSASSAVWNSIVEAKVLITDIDKPDDDTNNTSAVQPDKSSSDVIEETNQKGTIDLINDEGATDLETSDTIDTTSQITPINLDNEDTTDVDTSSTVETVDNVNNTKKSGGSIGVNSIIVILILWCRLRSVNKKS